MAGVVKAMESAMKSMNLEKVALEQLEASTLHVSFVSFITFIARPRYWRSGWHQTCRGDRPVLLLTGAFSLVLLDLHHSVNCSSFHRCVFIQIRAAAERNGVLVLVSS
jgi:hypothetical protein